MEMVMRSEFVLFCLLLAPYLFASSIFSAADSASDALAQQCANELLTKLSPCLDYSTGKAELPTKECCTSVTSMRDQHPVCLCFLIQQTHNGRPEVKQLGLKEDRLLKISGTCKLTNASISECPRKSLSLFSFSFLFSLMILQFLFFCLLLLFVESIYHSHSDYFCRTLTVLSISYPGSSRSTKLINLNCFNEYSVSPL
uniref:Bifunctional inhibitor/plant lipid transfer protein/seed storage helical domain-containing protein n=1 Tax=Nelumbo nucifera TaxID=4432 RepID=A0A822YT15_NELNU|nr:TPA_asm: hypothetical protein HUJ06_004875 [Nelumbo nucifera]